MTTNNIVPFIFEDKDPLRVIMKNGEPWFVAADPCRIIGLSNPRQALEPLDDDEKGVSISDTPGGRQEVRIISESGLYALVLRSHTAMVPGSPAHRFRRWVTGEVLPALRKTGAYGRPSEPTMRDKILAVEKARTAFGAEAAKEMWFMLGLPVTPSMRDAQRNLFPRPGEGGGK